jgi:hypothetical protein
MSAAAIEEPRYTARDLLREIHRRGGRVNRMRQHAVFCLTTDPKLAEWLLDMGGKAYTPPGIGDALSVDGGYRRDGRSQGVREWDIYIHAIPVKGEETVWEVAKRNKRVELEVIE